MQVFSRWVLPIAMVAVGIAILSGILIPSLPNGNSLRFMFGIVAILLGILRFASSRSGRPTEDDRRRFGGERKRPWEDK
jgi:hypothetical protein